MVWLLLAVFAVSAGCGRRRVVTTPPPAPAPAPTPAPGPAKPPPVAPVPKAGARIEDGMASWYGPPFHGRKAANGEVYDMYKLTAAHRTLPFNTVVRVTNLKNLKHTDVRITDRGPFVEGRIIDLSLEAARQIDMVGVGTALVRLEFISGPAQATGQFTVQVGAFLDRANAVRVRQQLERRYQPVFVMEYDSPKGMFYRVRVGRVATEKAADRLAERLRAEEKTFVPFVVRLDE
ncbi:MAG: septal ring lytic transglycosylase RlpA family protein [Acidobacteria bacterium]|nr:septal ring lytic transglycosylase RlpA family protein [Acidobacteriota bacterium]